MPYPHGLCEKCHAPIGAGRLCLRCQHEKAPEIPRICPKCIGSGRDNLGDKCSKCLGTGRI